jgi:putative flippase GtrA
MKIFHFFDSVILFFVPQRFLRVVRYLIAGGTAALVNLVSLFVFTSLLNVWYLLSAIIAFVVAFVVSFLLSKFWTFTDNSTAKWKSQVAMYLVITGTNLGINTLLMYLAVDMLGVHYMIAQFIISGLIACESYFAYQIFVFKKSKNVSLASLADSHEQI